MKMRMKMIAMLVALFSITAISNEAFAQRGSGNRSQYDRGGQGYDRHEQRARTPHGHGDKWQRRGHGHMSRHHDHGNYHRRDTRHYHSPRWDRKYDKSRYDGRRDYRRDNDDRNGKRYRDR